MSNDLQIESLLRENESLRERNKELRKKNVELKIQLLKLTTVLTTAAGDAKKICEEQEVLATLPLSPVDASKTYCVHKQESESESLYKGDSSGSVVVDELVKEKEMISEPLHAAIARTAHFDEKRAKIREEIAPKNIFSKAEILEMVRQKLSILQQE